MSWTVAVLIVVVILLALVQRHVNLAHSRRLNEIVAAHNDLARDQSKACSDLLCRVESVEGVVPPRIDPSPLPAAVRQLQCLFEKMGVTPDGPDPIAEIRQRIVAIESRPAPDESDHSRRLEGQDERLAKLEAMAADTLDREEFVDALRGLGQNLGALADQFEQEPQPIGANP